MSPQALLTVYTSLVRPCFDYACVVYHSLLSKTLSDALERQQRKILKIIYGFDVSYNTALARSGLDRLDARRCTLRERFVMKLSRNPCFESWFPLNETPEYDLRTHKKYSELQFRTERSRAAPIYTYCRILNALTEDGLLD